jgi:hypothetical protein
MNKNTNSNINLSPIYNLSKLRDYINNLIELENKSHLKSKEGNKNLHRLIKLSDVIINNNKLNLEFLNKNKLNLELSNSKNFNTELDNLILNESNSILKNEQQYIGLISSFNSKIANFTIDIYTFTNRPYKQINKIVYILYTICKSAFLNMSSIISKPIVSINPKIIKITLFFY